MSWVDENDLHSTHIVIPRGDPWHVKRSRLHWRSAAWGALMATFLIALSQALSSVPGWILPAIGAALVALALAVI